MESTATKSTLSVPAAIILAGALIAGAVFLSGGRGTTPEKVQKQEPAAVVSPPALNALTLRPVDEARDHIRGNPSANIVFVEFSDTECPFCKRFHFTMQQIINEYGKSGKVA